MQKYKRKSPVSHTCQWCNRMFTWTRPFMVHLAQIGEKNCVKPRK